MSIVIKGMKIPESCLDCKFTKEKFSSLGRFINCCLGLGDVVGYSTGQHVDDRHPDCPLDELPEHHGRLIDADALIAESLKDGAYGYVDTKQIYDAPTIIEAE